MSIKIFTALVQKTIQFPDVMTVEVDVSFLKQCHAIRVILVSRYHELLTFVEKNRFIYFFYFYCVQVKCFASPCNFKRASLFEPSIKKILHF